MKLPFLRLTLLHAVRFPRMVKFRDDKGVEQITDLKRNCHNVGTYGLANIFISQNLLFTHVHVEYFFGKVLHGLVTTAVFALF